jgi:DNA-directed DNA polymerase III PolC
MSVPLHVHSWYSLLEGASSPTALLERAAAAGHEALALTDTNNLYGAAGFVTEARRRGVRPLLGACLRQQRTRCVALIAEPVGYRSLCRILSRLHLRQDLLVDLLRADAEGLHVLVDDAPLAERLREAFGNRLWLEIVRPGRGARHEAELLACGQRLGLRPVATTAAHFVTSEEHRTFRLITAVRQATLLERLPRTLPLTPAHALATPDELHRRFADLPAAVRNARLLAGMLRSDVLPRDLVLPPARVPRQLGEYDFLRLLCERGLRERGLAEDATARARLREELALIADAGLGGYFLTVRDVARHARRQGHSMALRGSAGNSLACYLLAITDVNPLRFQLPLERFLHPGRTDLPDIDLDFDWKVRDEAIAYVFRRYGPERVAQISTHLFLQPRSAFREAAKIHGMSETQISQLLETLATPVEGLFPERDAEGPVPLAPRLFPLEPERWPRLVADARRLLGRPRHLSLHPGGIVITPGPIEDHAPLERAAKGVVVTQFEKEAVEQVGLVKIDLLGNRALATVDEARQWVRKGRLRIEERKTPARSSGGGTRSLQRWRSGLVDVAPRLLAFHPPSIFRRRDPGSQIPDNDPATVALLQKGDTLGVNQLESPAMRHLLVQMRPRGIEDVIQALALVRPAAASIGAKECFIRRRRRLDPVRLAHPLLERVLDETHGLMVFEDDALRLVQALTGLPAPEADRFRKRIAKHRGADEARALETEFRELCEHRGVPAAAVAEVWPQLAKFNRYSFCKSHAVSYGLIAWSAAYLKAHHPLAFWTAALNNNQGCYPQRVYVEASKRAGIPLRLPCVNRSTGPFRVEDNAIRVGLNAIAGLPEEVQTAILDERARNGPYRDLADFRGRVHPGPETLALLIRCGALDWTRRPRPALFLDADLQDRARTDGSELFAWSPAEGWTPDDYPAVQRWRDEWELLGFVVGPPLLALLRQETPADDGPPFIRSRDVAAHVGRPVRIRGVVATHRHTFTEDGRPMQFITLEDEDGLTDVTIFPGTCAPVPHLGLGPYVAAGIVEDSYGVRTVTAHHFGP